MGVCVLVLGYLTCVRSRVVFIHSFAECFHVPPRLCGLSVLSKAKLNIFFPQFAFPSYVLSRKSILLQLSPAHLCGRRMGANHLPLYWLPDPAGLISCAYDQKTRSHDSSPLRSFQIAFKATESSPPPRPPGKRSRLRLGSKGFARTHIPVLSNRAHKTKNLPDPLPTSGQRMTGTLLLLVFLGQTYGGFDDPAKARQILARQMGKPCNCAGGTLSQYPEGRVRHVQSVSCGDKIAYNFIGSGYESSSNRYSHIGKANSWQCINTIQTPEPLPPGQLKNSSCLEYQETLHSLCYLKEQARQCRGPKNKTY